jgi:hypothetical protein
MTSHFTHGTKTIVRSSLMGFSCLAGRCTVALLFALRRPRTSSSPFCYYCHQSPKMSSDTQQQGDAAAAAASSGGVVYVVERRVTIMTAVHVHRAVTSHSLAVIIPASPRVAVVNPYLALLIFFLLIAAGPT